MKKIIKKHISPHPQGVDIIIFIVVVVIVIIVNFRYPLVAIKSWQHNVT